MDFLAFAWSFNVFGLVQSPASHVAALMAKEGNCSQIVDLCSGGGGGSVAVVSSLGKDVHLRFSDLFPQISTWTDICKRNDNISYISTPVDATQFQQENEGIRLMLNSFHHFKPLQATQILKDAVDSDKCSGIVVAELTQRSMLSIGYIFCCMFFMATIGSLLLRPLSVRRFGLTFIFPIVPFVMWFDGVVSCLRSYTHEEINAMITNADQKKQFRWSVQTKWIGMAPVTSIMGFRKK